MGAFPVLFYFAHNIQKTPPGSIFLPLLVSLAIAALAYAAAFALCRHRGKAALLASLFMVFFASYGHLFESIRGAALAHFVVGRTRFLLPLWCALFAVAAFFAARVRRDAALESLNGFLNLLALILVATSAVQIGYFEARRLLHGPSEGWIGAAPSATPRVVRPVPAPQTPRAAGNPALDSTRPAEELPDIYYIIPDSYESDAALREVFGYDNRPFTDYLKGKGFYVASESHSNYAFTALSIPSSLNMMLLDDLPARVGRDSRDENPVRELLRSNAVMGFLKAKGYTLINSGSWWGPTSKNGNADINYKTSYLDEVNLGLLQTTLLSPFIEEFSENDLRKEILAAFARLQKIPLMDEPTFTLAHIICPHPPFVFGPDGGKIPTLKRIAAKSDARDLYRDQVIFINKKLREAVDTILSRSKTPPIIIIQGDHGAAYTRSSMGYTHVVPNAAYLREQMSILNAYYLPGKADAGLYPSITPANSFRVVFNAYFGAGFPMVGDSSFYSSRNFPYDFANVTETVRGR
jgi:hypothetical protein